MTNCLRFQEQKDQLLRTQYLKSILGDISCVILLALWKFIFSHFLGCVQNCREIEIVERWKWVSEIVERWKQVSEIVEKYFPVKSSSQNLREIEFVENMKVSFRNCRELWKQVSEIVEKGIFFLICREQDKTANRMGKKMIMALPWLLDGTIWL